MNLKSLPLEERPRERLARYGIEGLSSIELLAILLGSGTQTRSVLHLAGDLLGRFGSLRALTEATLEELKTVKGIGEAKAIQLQAAFALLSRVEPKQQGPLLDTPKKVYDWIHSDLSSQKVEKLMVILRDARKAALHREILGMGTLTEVLLHPREIFHAAIRHRAHSVIVAHNHPSGDPTPSSKDIDMTHILITAGRVVGIELSDHLVVGAAGFTSLYERGLFRRLVY